MSINIVAPIVRQHLHLNRHVVQQNHSTLKIYYYRNKNQPSFSNSTPSMSADIRPYCSLSIDILCWKPIECWLAWHVDWHSLLKTDRMLISLTCRSTKKYCTRHVDMMSRLIVWHVDRHVVGSVDGPSQDQFTHSHLFPMALHYGVTLHVCFHLHDSSTDGIIKVRVSLKWANIVIPIVKYDLGAANWSLFLNFGITIFFLQIFLFWSSG